MPEGARQQTPVCPSAHHPGAVIGFVHGRESGDHHLISRLSVPHRAYMGILILFRHDFIVLRQQPMPGLQHHKPNPGLYERSFSKISIFSFSIPLVISFLSRSANPRPFFSICLAVIACSSICGSAIIGTP